VISQDLAIDLVWTSPLDTITATTNPATGFGFSLAQHLIKLHGGSGFYDNPPGVAGRYRMLVPLHPSTPTDDSEFS
jgi:nitrogen-specific signal transduction histidine kinase